MLTIVATEVQKKIDKEKRKKKRERKHMKTKAFLLRLLQLLLL